MCAVFSLSSLSFNAGSIQQLQNLLTTLNATVSGTNFFLQQQFEQRIQHYPQTPTSLVQQHYQGPTLFVSPHSDEHSTSSPAFQPHLPASPSTVDVLPVGGGAGGGATTSPLVVAAPPTLRLQRPDYASLQLQAAPLAPAQPFKYATRGSSLLP